MEEIQVKLELAAELGVSTEEGAGGQNHHRCHSNLHHRDQELGEQWIVKLIEPSDEGEKHIFLKHMI